MKEFYYLSYLSNVVIVSNINGSRSMCRIIIIIFTFILVLISMVICLVIVFVMLNKRSKRLQRRTAAATNPVVCQSMELNPYDTTDVKKSSSEYYNCVKVDALGELAYSSIPSEPIYEPLEVEANNSSFLDMKLNVPELPPRQKLPDCAGEYMEASAISLKSEDGYLPMDVGRGHMKGGDYEEISNLK